MIDGGTGNQAARFYADENTPFTVATTEVVLSSPVQFNQFDWWGAYDPGTPNSGASVQLDVRLGAAGDQARDGIQRHLPETVQRQLVHLVE